jgi:4'-phosphopantetheinyl transferase
MKITKHNLYIDEFNLIRSEKKFKATLCYCYFSGNADYKTVIPYLHPYENNYFSKLKFEKRAKSYLVGRYTAKEAIAFLTGEGNLANILIESGVFTQPVVASNGKNTQVSISHCDDFGAALAFPEAHPMGIDLEIISSKQREALEGQVTEWEKQQIISLPFAYDAGLTLLWTAKEALSKVMKTGLMTPFHVFSISSMERSKHFIMCYFENFPQYKALCFPIGRYMCAIVYPLKTELGFDPYELVQYFSIIL